MVNLSIRKGSKRFALILALVLIPAGKLLAQQAPFAASMKTNLVQPAAPAYGYTSYVQTRELGDREHHFWDRSNAVLFAAVGASATADFFVTRANLASGGRELNPVTGVLAGSTTGLAFNFIGETAGSIGVSYLFHKTGHHKLERLTSYVNIGASAGAVGFGLTHR
jgi:hypothetical protein